MPVKPPEPRFELTPAEWQTAVWQKLEAHLRERLASYRRKNDAPTLSESETALNRGRIAELKHLIGLGGKPAD